LCTISDALAGSATPNNTIKDSILKLFMAVFRKLNATVGRLGVILFNEK